MQIVQEIVKRPSLNKAGFELQTIFVPTLQEKVYFCLIKVSISIKFSLENLTRKQLVLIKSMKSAKK